MNNTVMSKVLVITGMLLLSKLSVAQNWINATKASIAEEAGLRIMHGGSVQYYIYSDNYTDALNFQSTSVSGENDNYPRIQLPFTSPNIHLGLSGGNVGIGTASPAYKLEVAGGAIALDADQPLRGGGKWLISGNSSMVTVGTANPGVGLRFYAGADVNRMIIDAATGNVGIGSQTPSQKLTVNGTIYGKEVKVDLSVPGPDYVFADNYQLPTLNELKTYIDLHKHLPEVPSAAAMEVNGINLGEMNMILLKKIEELTLYQIETQKKIESLLSRIRELETKTEQK